MKTKSLVVTLFLIGGLFFLPVSELRSDQGADIVILQTGIEVTGGAGATYLLLRIAGPDGRIIFDQSSNGGSISWTPAGSLSDGHYSYEVVFQKTY